jgi:hypothetical protein
MAVEEVAFAAKTNVETVAWASFGIIRGRAARGKVPFLVYALKSC